jgi:catechol 1,2-dioxygenase
MTTDECTPTQSDVKGPYYLSGTPFRTALAEPDEPGEPLILQGTLLHFDCKTPIKDVLIEIWQPDAQGKYHGKEDNYRLRGQLRSNHKGQYEFSTVKPGRYGILSGYRPAHIHFQFSHPDYETLITQLYFKGDPYLWPHDACGSGCKSDDPKRIIELTKYKKGKYEVLQGIFNVILKPLK